MSRRVSSMLAAGALLALGACNTVSGFGRDLQALGRGIGVVSAETQQQLFQPRYAVGSRARACDASGTELAGASGLPPC